MKTSLPSEQLDDLPPHGFASHLRDELARRCSANPHYSLRAFAIDLGTDHATLSQLIHGKRRLTPEMIRRLGSRLRLSAADVAAYEQRERLTRETGAGESAMLQARRLTAYAARVVEQWEHFALLELTHLRDFRPDVRWIARVLDISPDEVNLAVNRLIHLGLLELDGDSWRDRGGSAIAGVEHFTGSTVEQLRERVAALIRAAQRGTGQQDHSSTTIAVSHRRVARAIERLHELRRQLVQALESDDGCDEVYRLDIHLYPVTHRSDIEEHT